MSYQVVTKSVEAQPLAAVRRRVRLGKVGTAWKPAAPGEAEMVVDFGVQVSRPFQDAGEVVCTETPAGDVAMTTHVGSHGKLAAAHAAINSWRAATGRAFGACSWEIYGDWTDDEAKLETQVVYLLS